MKKILILAKETFLHWQSKRASRMGAAISFYAIFSIAPFFILLIGIAGTIFDKQATIMAVHHTLNVTVGSNLANVIQSLINSASHGTNGIIAALISAAILIIAALSVFSELDSDLDELWALPVQDEEEQNAGQIITHYVRARLINFGLILLCGFLLLLSVALTVIGSFFGHVLPDILRDNATLVWMLNILLSLLDATVLFALIYRVLPETKLPWREVLWGAFVTALLFLAGRFLIGWYIDTFGATGAYGAAGSVVGLLLWIYYSAQVFFIGASGTFVYSSLYGSIFRKHQKRYALD